MKYIKYIMNITLVFAACISNFSLSMEVKKKPVNKKVIFAHGYGAARYQGLDYSFLCRDCNSLGNRNSKIDMRRFDFPDSGNLSSNNYKLNSSRTTFGQGEEKELLESKYKLAKKDGGKVLLAGVSRGAMCVLNVDCPDSVGRFAESPAATLKDVVDHKCKEFGFGWVPCLGRFIHRFFIKLLFRSYNPTGLKPIDAVESIPKNTPVFIACTKKDILIPASSSAKLAEALVKSGNKNVYLYVSDEGEHVCILSGESEKGKYDYRLAANTFLRKHNFICADSVFSSVNNSLYESNVKDLKEKICNLIDKYNMKKELKGKIRNLSEKSNINDLQRKLDRLFRKCRIKELQYQENVFLDRFHMKNLEQVRAIRRGLEAQNWKKFWGRNLAVFSVVATGVGIFAKKVKLVSKIFRGMGKLSKIF